MKDAIKNILKGAVIGVANIIPGVSGGTMAVSMGIYDAGNYHSGRRNNAHTEKLYDI